MPLGEEVDPPQVEPERRAILHTQPIRVFSTDIALAGFCTLSVSSVHTLCEMTGCGLYSKGLWLP